MPAVPHDGVDEWDECQQRKNVSGLNAVISPAHASFTEMLLAEVVEHHGSSIKHKMGHHSIHCAAGGASQITQCNTQYENGG